MKTFAFTAAAILVATSSAFAGSDHFGARAAGQASATIDNTYTASMRRPDMVRHGVRAAMQSDAEDPGQGVWGR